MNLKQLEIFAYLCVIIFIKAIVVLFAWNSSIPMIFTDADAINLQQSICIVVLATCLFHSHRIFMIHMMLIDFYRAFFSEAIKKQNSNNKPLKPPKSNKSNKNKKKFKE